MTWTVRSRWIICGGSDVLFSDHNRRGVCHNIAYRAFHLGPVGVPRFVGWTYFCPNFLGKCKPLEWAVCHTSNPAGSVACVHCSNPMGSVDRFDDATALDVPFNRDEGPDGS